MARNSDINRLYSRLHDAPLRVAGGLGSSSTSLIGTLEIVEKPTSRRRTDCEPLSNSAGGACPRAGLPVLAGDLSAAEEPADLRTVTTECRANRIMQRRPQVLPSISAMGLRRSRQQQLLPIQSANAVTREGKERFYDAVTVALPPGSCALGRCHERLIY